MSGSHAHKLRGVRGIDDATWQTFGEITDAMGTDRSAVVRQYIEWHIGRSVTMPTRPTR